MGAWGHEIFEDDSMLDALADFSQLPDPWPIMKAALSDVLDAEEVDYELAANALAVAGILDQRLNNIPHVQDDDEEFEWIAALDYNTAVSYAVRAAQAIEKITHDPSSELKELWEETQFFSDWTTHLWGVRDRLMNIGSTISH